MKIKDLLEITVDKKASDLHLIMGSPPILRIDGLLMPHGEKNLTEEEVKKLIFELLNDDQKELLLANKEIDFSFGYGVRARFRVNAYYERGRLAAALRCLPTKIRGIDELSLPRVFHEFTKLNQGFILVTGPTGHGKSTSLAAMIEEINKTRHCHVITIEDPIEYVFSPRRAIISQREMHLDTHSWAVSLRSCLREDADVVLIGEMRDYETIAAALTIAETGHLVFATLHTNSAAQTVDRIVDVFPPHQQEQVKMQFSNTLEAIISQRLIPCLSGGRISACEILVATSAVRTTIREGKTHLIDNIIQTSAEVGMVSLESDLTRLVKTGKISLETARSWATKPEELMRQVKR
jgi:twitching motility protein PilT